jgi:SET domain-containing protein
MLLVKTYLDRSAIHGIGLFASEPIAAGTVIWRMSPTIDVQLAPPDIEALSRPARAQIEKYIYLDKVLRTYVLCGDDARFFNHSESPNCRDLPDERGGTTVAARDIAAGEELTCDYAAFDANFGLGGDKGF